MRLEVADFIADLSCNTGKCMASRLEVADLASLLDGVVELTEGLVHTDANLELS